MLDEAGIKCFGVSYDGKESHVAFRDKYGLTTPLLMDTDKGIGKAYGQPQGKHPDRHTIVIDKSGKIAGTIQEIDFDNHAAQIISALR